MNLAPIRKSLIAGAGAALPPLRDREPVTGPSRGGS